MNHLTGNVLLTGGTGFLGRGILKRAHDENWPCDITVYSRDEHKQDLCKRRWPDVKYVLGDICDQEGLQSALRANGIDVIVHTAAVKFIPEAEHNVNECIRINIDGSRNVIRAAIHSSVGSVIGISTDKASYPLNTYGMTKAIMERMFGEAASRTGVRFTTCRYGNVVGSTGSVIPLFREQFLDNGFVTITDPNMTRFWISVDQAVDIVLMAHNATNGSTVIPLPAAMKIGDLAAFIAGEHVKYTGMRVGEKFHEQLLHEQESVRALKIGDHYELLDALHAPVGESFVLTSNNPSRWLGCAEMGAMIDASVEV